jgi:hypothetical protein
MSVATFFEGNLPAGWIARLLGAVPPGLTIKDYNHA